MDSQHRLDRVRDAMVQQRSTCWRFPWRRLQYLLGFSPHPDERPCYLFLTNGGGSYSRSEVNAKQSASVVRNNNTGVRRGAGKSPEGTAGRRQGEPPAGRSPAGPWRLVPVKTVLRIHLRPPSPVRGECCENLACGQGQIGLRAVFRIAPRVSGRGGEGYTHPASESPHRRVLRPPTTPRGPLAAAVHRCRCDPMAGMGRGCGERTPRFLCPAHPAPGGFDLP